MRAAASQEASNSLAVLAFNDRQVLVFIQFYLPGVHEFQQFAFNNCVGCVGEDSSDFGLVDFGDHAECA